MVAIQYRARERTIQYHCQQQKLQRKEDGENMGGGIGLGRYSNGLIQGARCKHMGFIRLF
jgi:hypothetical protein